MKTISTRGVLQENLSSNVVVLEQYLPLFEDPIYIYDFKERDALLSDGWEPINKQDWEITFKRLKPCEGCLYMEDYKASVQARTQEREKKHQPLTAMELTALLKKRVIWGPYARLPICEHGYVATDGIPGASCTKCLGV